MGAVNVLRFQPSAHIFASTVVRIRHGLKSVEVRNKPRLWTIEVLTAGLCGGVNEDGGGCFKDEAAVSGGPVNCAVVFGGVGDAVGY